MGEKGSGDIGIYMGLGALMGFIIDMFYGSAGGPGFNTPLKNCAALKSGDLVQISGAVLANMLSTFGRSWRLTAFTQGAMLGNLIPKVFEAFGISRYGVFDFDPATGAIKTRGGGIRQVKI